MELQPGEELTLQVRTVRTGTTCRTDQIDFSPQIFISIFSFFRPRLCWFRLTAQQLKGRDVWQLVCPSVSPLNLEKVRVETGGVSVSILSSLWHFTCFTF